MIRLTSWANCGLILVHHIRKPPSGGGRMMNVDLGMEDLSGSGYITQQARVVMGLHVVQTGPEFDPNGPRELKVLKNNLGAYPKPLGFVFEQIHPDGTKLKWDRNAPQEYREPTRLDDCKEWLEDLLRSNLDGLKVKEVVSIGNEQGFNRNLIFRARDELSLNIQNTIGRKTKGNAWKWCDTSADPSQG
jgi:hypothetical protein